MTSKAPKSGMRTTVAVHGARVHNLKNISLEIPRDQLIARLKERPGLVDLDTTLSLRKPEVQVIVDREAASDLGIPVGDIADTLRILVGGMPISKFRDGDECILVPGKEPMRRNELRIWLRQQFEDAKQVAEQRGEKNVNTAVVIRAHKEADYGQVFEILQLCKNVGYRRLMLRASSSIWRATCGASSNWAATVSN